MTKSSIIYFVLKVIFCYVLITLPAWSNMNRFIFEENLQNPFLCEIDSESNRIIIKISDSENSFLDQKSNDRYIQRLAISYQGPFIYKEKKVDSVTFSVSFPDGLDFLKLKDWQIKTEDENSVYFIDHKNKDKFSTTLHVFIDEIFDTYDFDISSIDISYDEDEDQIQLVFENIPENEFLFVDETNTAYVMTFFDHLPRTCLASVRKN